MFIRSGRLIWLAIIVGLTLPAQSTWAAVIGDALVIRYLQSGVGAGVENTVAGTGLNTTVLDRPAPGDVAAELAANQYDQIFIVDAPDAAIQLPNAADLAAVNAWHQSHPSVLLMGTAAGIFASNDALQPRFLENVVHNFDPFGGGLFIGADHAPNNVQFANAYLGALGYDLFSGFVGNGAVDGPGGSSWYTTPNIIQPRFMSWGVGAPSSWSVTSAPFGLQPNGKNLDRILWKTTDSLGNPIPEVNLISGQLTNIPEPSTAALLGICVVGMLTRRRRR